MGLRVCVVDRSDGRAAYPRLDEAKVDVMAHVPRVELFSPDLARAYDVVLLGALGSDAARPAWQEAIRHVTLVRPTLAVVESSDVGTIALLAPVTGLRGCVDRAVTPDAMRRSLEVVARGETAFPHAAVSSLLQADRGSRATIRLRLTPRQQEIAELIAQGATDREIARTLHISESTAHKHVQNALRRLGARTRSHLVARMGSISST
ncbi:MAG: response regulator transcription factor [Chloroflexota bacterium]|nr:response regulator transcription factor [Chloroflexota bacterium]MDE3101122.1 response regulator transcription factor [Chloroflexota bacterium]